MPMVMGTDGNLDQQKYGAYGRLQLPIAEPIPCCQALIAISAFLVYPILRHGKGVYRRIFQADGDSLYDEGDTRTQLMPKYPDVLHWWYTVISVSMLAVSIAVCEVYYLLPWYWILVGSAISFVYVIPNGILLG